MLLLEEIRYMCNFVVCKLYTEPCTVTTVSVNEVCPGHLSKLVPQSQVCLCDRSVVCCVWLAVFSVLGEALDTVDCPICF